MIFVTVGTHEQPFNRLLEEIDRLKGERAFDDEVIIQRGYSTYIPKNCTFFDFLSWEEMQHYNSEARIVITHGGPSSFTDVLAKHKVPIVVPRQKKFDEHVNNHQLDFANSLIQRGENIVVVDDISNLKEAILNHSDAFFGEKYDNSAFVSNFALELKKLFE